MARGHSMLGIAGALALVAACVASGAEVRTRVYGEAKPAATDGRVVTRAIETPAEPGDGLPVAGVTPFAFSIVPGVSLPPEDWAVVGLRINLFAGRHQDVWGIDAGVLGNEVDGRVTGLQVAGIWNHVGHGTAIQSAGIANLCDRDFNGVQSAGIYNRTGGTLTGLQAGLVNRAEVVAGLQVGGVNIMDNGHGVQIGLFNWARALEGLQIGLFNVNENSTLPYLPIINLAF